MLERNRKSSLFYINYLYSWLDVGYTNSCYIVNGSRLMPSRLNKKRIWDYFNEFVGVIKKSLWEFVGVRKKNSYESSWVWGKENLMTVRGFVKKKFLQFWLWKKKILDEQKWRWDETTTSMMGCGRECLKPTTTRR